MPAFPRFFQSRQMLFFPLKSSRVFVLLLPAEKALVDYYETVFLSIKIYLGSNICYYC